MANQILTSDVITKEALRILHERLSFVSSINRQYDSSFGDAGGGAKIGDSIRIRKPARYVTRDGAPLDPQEHRETNTQLTLTRQKGVDITVSSTELTLGIDDFSSRVLEPAMAQLASAIESDVLSVIEFTQNAVLTNSPSFKDVVLVKALLDQLTCPMDNNRTFMIDPIMQVDILDDTKGLFQDSSQISKQYLEGYIGKTGGFNFVQSSRMPNLVIDGTNAGITATGDFTQGGSTLAVSALAADVNAGQVFTVAGVFDVHPETKKPYSTLKKFVVAQDAAAGATSITFYAINDYSTSDLVGAGEGSTRLYPRGIEAGQKSYVVDLSLPQDANKKFNTAQANQSTLVATGAAITFLGDTAGAGVLSQSVGFHRDAYTVGFADLYLPKGTDMAARQTYEGISLRMVRDYDISSDTAPMRFDCIYGYQILRQEYACRLIQE